MPIGDWVQPPRHAGLVVREVAILDPQLPEIDALVEQLQAREPYAGAIDVVVLDGGEDGIAQVSEVLAGHRDLEAVHLHSQGANGTFRLADGWLDLVEVEARSDEFRAWGAALAPRSVLLLHGCDLASDWCGHALVDAIGNLTGAGVAACIGPDRSEPDSGEIERVRRAPVSLAATPAAPEPPRVRGDGEALVLLAEGSFHCLAEPDGASITATVTDLSWAPADRARHATHVVRLAGSACDAFHVSTIADGRLFHADGDREVRDGDRITPAEAAAGLLFAPASAESGKG